MQITVEKLKELLVKSGQVPEKNFQIALMESLSTKKPIDWLLIEKGYISSGNYGKILADFYHTEYADLTKYNIPLDLVKIIPELVSRAQRAIVFDRDGVTLSVATTRPDNYEFFKLLEKRTGLSIKVFFTTPMNLENALNMYKGDLGDQVKKLIDDLKANPQNEENIVKLVNLIMEYAHDNRASDIHIEPMKIGVSVRFRIDGVLHEAVIYPLEIHPRVVFRIKIMSQLRTDEHGAAQDGRFSYKQNQISFDVRVSILPITNGENIVMRILSESSRRYNLEDLGFLPEDLKRVRRASEKPYGMILSAGPTGSGKTTCLYAILQILNKPTVNIMTIEDPVEYAMEHIQQTQVNLTKKLTFANGLRSIVRQDPDIIMVGEIRDNDTASIAVNAAMTGHLLLSTLHANDASTSFPRLIDMGMEPFLIASSVNVIVAQRLVRKICEECVKKHRLDSAELEAIKLNQRIAKMIEVVVKRKDFQNIEFFKGEGCKRCSRSGYNGRVGIFEVMEVTDEIKSLVTRKATAREIEIKAREQGMQSMLYDGMRKVIQGITTLEEIIRVTES